MTALEYGLVTKAPARCEIRELSAARGADRRLFVSLPFELARTVDAWHPGVRKYYSDLIHPRRNPFWRGRDAWFFVAIRGGRVVGRMGLVDVGNLPQRPDAAMVIMPDFIDDAEVVGRLVDAVSERARERGARELIGPMNPNIHHDVGIQVSGFEMRNAIFMGYQPPYYARQLEACGFTPIAEFEAWRLYEEHFLRDGQLRALAERVERAPALRIRSADLARFGRELEIFHRLYSASFADHWGFVAPTWDEFEFMAGDMRLILRENMALVAEWDGEPVGFVLSVPDLYGIVPKGSRGRLTPRFLAQTLWRWRAVDEVRVMIAGVLPAYRRFGVHVPLFYRVACHIFDLGFRGGEISWVMRENRPMMKVLPLLGARPAKRYRLYGRPLAAPEH